jgi:hypothetical protein
VWIRRSIRRVRFAGLEVDALKRELYLLNLREIQTKQPRRVYVHTPACIDPRGPSR